MEQFKGAYVEKNYGTIIQNLIAEPKPRIKAQTVYNLTGLNSKVFGRDDEAKILGDVLCGENEFTQKHFFLIVAPSGFGKSYLLTKTLQEVTDGTNIEPAYAKYVQRIIRLDCRNIKSAAAIVSEFTNIIGLSFEYPPDFDAPFEYINGFLFHYVRSIGKVWLVLDNFESWLDGENNYQPINAEVQAFLKALFVGNHTLRGVFLTQSTLHFEADEHFEVLEEISRNIAKGLPQKDALEMLKINGKDVDLANETDTDLIKFLDKTTNIPQAISSLIGYLRTKKNTPNGTFQSVLRDFDKFDEHEQKDGESHTKFLIARQIKAQSENVKLLLQAIAFFDKEVSYETLSAFCDDDDIARLVSHNLATLRQDYRGTFYYDLHPYFREQSRQTLSHFEDLSLENLKKYIIALRQKGRKSAENSYFERALSLFDCVREILHIFITQKGITLLEIDLANLLVDQSASLRRLNKFYEADLKLDEVIDYYKKSLTINSDELKISLMRIYNHKGLICRNLWKFDEAIKFYSEAIKFYRRLSLEQKKDVLIIDDTAVIYINKSTCIVQLAGQGLTDLEQLEDSSKEIEKAVKMLEKISQSGNKKFKVDLAGAYKTKGEILSLLNKFDEAMIVLNEAINLFEKLITEEQMFRLNQFVASSKISRGLISLKLKNFDGALIDYDSAIETLEVLIADGRIELEKDLAIAYANKGSAFRGLNKFYESIQSCDKSEKIHESCIKRGELFVLTEFIKNVKSRFFDLLVIGNWLRAADDLVKIFQKEKKYKVGLNQHSQQIIAKEINEVIQLIKRVSPDNRERIYTNLGEWGNFIRNMVDG